AIVLGCVLALSLIGASLYAFPYPLKMEVAGQVLPVVRRTVYTPNAGTIERFEVKPGDYVHEGQALARVYDSTLMTKASDLLATIEAAQREANDILGSRLEKLQGVPESERMDLRTRAALKEAEAKAKRSEYAMLTQRTNMVTDTPRLGVFTLL